MRIRMWMTAVAFVGLLGASLPTQAANFDCGGFLALDREMQTLTSWALVEGGIAVRASYQADAMQLRRDGDEENADGSSMVARAIAEKLRPALHRSSKELGTEVSRRCLSYNAKRPLTLVYLEVIDAWRREGPAPSGPVTLPSH